MSLFSNDKANPALENGFEKVRGNSYSENMTVRGSIGKTILLLIALGFSSIVSYLWLEKLGYLNSALLIGSIVITLVLGLVTSFVPKIAWATSPIYAVAEGVLLGNLSFYANQYYPGIAMLAVLITILITFSMTIVYAFNPSIGRRFRKAIIGMTLAVGLLYLLTFILGLFGITIPYIYSNGPIGIGVSAVILIIASLNLLLDLDFIVEMSRAGAPKYMEWYAGFGLMITLVWIYIRVLDLLMRIFADKD